MFLLIVDAYKKWENFVDFNTSHVSINQVKRKLVRLDLITFQYISCFY